MHKAIFYDRDGTLIEDRDYAYKIEDFKLLPGVIEGLRILSEEFVFFVITNQAGIGRGIFTIEDMHKFNEKLLNELKKESIEIKRVYYCPHEIEDNCDCRKPSIKNIKQAEKEFNIDLRNSWVIGDRPSDIEMGVKAGCRNIYMLTGHGQKHLDDLKKKSIKPNFIAENFLQAIEFIIKISNLKNAKKIINPNELKSIAAELKKENKKIVTTNGVFDILHIGHIRYLQEAKKLGDVLVVAINSNSSTKNIKGPKRPLNNENDRAEALASLECVDYVTIFNEEDPVKILGDIKPDIHVKGGDYDISQIIEKDAVEKNNGKIVLIPKVRGYSTTDFIKKIVDLYRKN